MDNQQNEVTFFGSDFGSTFICNLHIQVSVKMRIIFYLYVNFMFNIENI